MNFPKATSLALAGALSLAACAGPQYYAASSPSYPASQSPVSQYPGSPYPGPAPERIEYGTVENIEMYRSGDPGPISLGSVLGGVAGGIIGHQFGSGSGNTAATIAGALGGAVVGNQVERTQQRDQYRVYVRLDSGATFAVTEVGEGQLRVGDRVRVVNNRVYRS